MPDLVPWPRGIVIPEDVWASNPTTRNTLTASGTPHAVGSWVEVITALDFEAHGLRVISDDNVSQNTVETSMLLDIGLGPATEVVAVSDIVVGGLKADVGFFSVDLPIRIPAGTRVVARNRALIASDTITVRVEALRKGFHRPASRCITYGANQAGSSGTAVTPGNGAWGTAVEIVASTTDAMRYALLSFGLRATEASVLAGNWYFRIVTGASLNQIEVPFAGRAIAGAAESVTVWTPTSPVNIPKGTRVGVQAWGPSTSNDLAVCLHAFD